MERRIVTTTRACEARLVPTGDQITIPAGAFITLTQSLGGTFTVVIEGNMARIAGADADAIGLKPEVLEFEEANPDGSVKPEHVRQALESVFDPEIPVNIADLGLIYDTTINDGVVNIKMTLTAPGCGMGPVLVQEVKDRVATVPNVSDVSVELVFDPPWSREMMSEEAQLELGVFQLMDVAELRETFTFFDDWEDKYRFVIDLGKELEDIPEGDKEEKNLIRGCQSQVWLTHTLTDDGTIHFKLDSDAFIVRGLISIVLTALNNKRPEDVLAFDIYALFEELELLQHLSQTRGNGLRAMIARIREIAEDLAQRFLQL